MVNMINLEKIKETISKRKPKPVDVNRHYAVAVPLYFNEKKGIYEVIYEVRSRHISQPMEISFPGGRLEKDESYEEAAIRETCEELLISSDKIEVIGEMDYLVTTGVMTIRCFLVLIKDVDIDQIEPDKNEVDHIFTVPLSFLANEKPLESVLTMNVEEDTSFPYELIPNGRKYNFSKAKNIVLFYEYNNYIIWGFTAKMTRSTIKILDELGVLNEFLQQDKLS